ncbi:MAG: response regulator [Planctomycetes bacterium]|nr:response regulator [Planctomycetota bacterium]
MSARKIMVVEDEKDMAELIAMRLKREHYEVEVVHDGLTALNRIRADAPDLLLLDLMLPRLSGTELAAELRRDERIAHVPIIMLTARGETTDEVLGLGLGADDYITKPFSMSVLLARIAAVFRRADRAEGGDILTAGPILVDRQRYRVNVDAEPVDLTRTEFRLLAAIVAARGRVLTRSQLIDQALGMDAVVTDRTIDVHITSLRRKLGTARGYVQTVRGVGYRLASTGDEKA